MYENGYLVMRRDQTQAVFWYRKAALAGNVRAQTILDSLSQDGDGAKRNSAQTYDLLNEKADEASIGSGIVSEPKLEPKPVSKFDAAVDVISFLSLIVIGYLFEWKTKDLIWGLWLSSLCLGALAFIAQLILRPIFDNGKKAVMRVAILTLGVLKLAFYTFHYGGFHFIHSIFLGGWFPLDGAPHITEIFNIPVSEATPILMEIYKRVALTYWPVALFYILEQKTLLIKSAVFSNAGYKDERSFNNSVYKNVIKMHLLLFVFGFALNASEIDSFLLYAIVCTFYFFPFRELKPIFTKK